MIDNPSVESNEEVEPDLTQDSVFLERVDKVFTLIHNDDAQRDRCIAETYVFICTMEQAVRKMMVMGGPMALIKNMVGGNTPQ